MELRNAKDWSIALDENAKTVKQYEDMLSRLFKHINVKLDTSTPLTCGFYKKYPFKISNQIFKSLKASSILGAVSALLSWVFLVLKSDSTMALLDRVSNYGVSRITPAACIGVGVMALISTLYVLISKARYKSIVTNLDNIENSLKSFMSTVPSGYRTSEKMQNIALIFHKKLDINPEIVLKCVDDYMNHPKYVRVCEYDTLMYDIACNCPFLGIDDNSIIPSYNVNINDPNESKNNTTRKKSPYLPVEIDDMVFAGSENSDKDLQEMIGLEAVKQQIEKFKNRIKFFGSSNNNGNHMAFLGSAGTGKTSVARIITGILYDLGFIKDNQYLEIRGDFLCNGDTNRANAIVEYAFGRVLFIDEAYLMYKSDVDITGVLLKAMEDHRSEFVCILAGYEEQMTKLFASNEGFSSRIKHTIYFPDYTEQEMLEIFNYFTNDYQGKTYRLTKDAIPVLLDAFKLEKKAKSFGNARTVRNAVDKVIDYYVDRSITNNTDTRLLTIDDVTRYYEDRKQTLQHEFKNASAADQLDEQIIRLSELKPRVKDGSENPDKDMEDLVGLDTLKEEINSLQNQREFFDEAPIQKILLLGPEGCGKSSVAKILTGYLYKFGYITENKYLDIPAELLKGSFVGHTAKRAQAIISYATGGVLFITNYNALASANEGFANEAMAAITTALNENNITIILADENSEYIDSLKSLFTTIYEFPEYGIDDLFTICVKNFNKNGFRVSEPALDKLYDNFKTRNNLDIRTVLKVCQNSIKTHINNFNGDEDQKYMINENDITLSEPMKLKFGMKQS